MKKYFVRNGYPVKLIEERANKKIDTLSHAKPLIHTVPKLDLYAAFPYSSRTNNRNIHGAIKKIVQGFFPQINLKIVFKNGNSVSSFFSFKDTVPSLLRSNIMYRYSCAQCPATYYGETTRHMCTRIAEHKGLSVRTGKPVTKPLNSSIRDHSIQTGHDLLNSNFTIAFSTNSCNLKISESILIQQNSPDLNNTDSSVPLNILS